MSARGLSIDSLAAMYRGFGLKPRRDRPGRKSPAPAQEREDGAKSVDDGRQWELFETEANE
jgi:hypothetical protein